MATLVRVEPEFVPQQTKEQFQSMSNLGDLEFEAGLQEVLDPISRLGLDPQRGLVALQDSAAKFSGEHDIVNVGMDFTSSKAVWAHEFRHRGFNMMRQAFDRDAFTERFGVGAASVLYDLDNERLVELFDRELKPVDWKDSKGATRKFEDTYDFAAPNFTDAQKDDLIMILSTAAKEAMGTYGKLVPVHPKGMQ